MPRPKTDTVPVVVQMQRDVAEALRAIVKRDGLNQSVFVTQAVTRGIKNHRSPLEFIAEGRDKKDRAPVPGVVDLGLDRPDGVPLACTNYFTVRNWQDNWRMLRAESVRGDIDEMRSEANREPITDAEWKAVCKYMGGEPGSARGKVQDNSEFGEQQHD